MTKTIQTVLALIIVFNSLSVINVFAQKEGVHFELLTFDEAVTVAKLSDKLLFIDCYTDWCGPCKKLDKDFFPNKEIGDFYNHHFVNIKMNMETSEGSEIAKLYGIQSYPTLLFINPHTKKTIYRLIGIGDNIDWLIKSGEKAINPQTNLEGLEKSFDSDKNPEVLSEYLSVLRESQLYDQINDVLNLYFLSLNSDEIVSEHHWSLISQNINDVEDSCFDFFMQYRDDFECIVGK